MDESGRAYLVSEAVGTLSGPARYYRRTDPQAVQQGQAAAHARVHDPAASDDRYCGLLAWSGLDYLSGSGNQYRGVKYTGVVDLFRVPKLSAPPCTRRRPIRGSPQSSRRRSTGISARYPRLPACAAR